MSAELGFVACLLLTLALLAAVVATGLRARRRLHVPLVFATLAALGVTIYFAKGVGDHYDLGSAGAITPVHLALAKLTTLAYLLPIASGIATLRNPARRRLHRVLAFTVVGMTVLTAITGTWMLAASERLPSEVGALRRDEDARARRDAHGVDVPDERPIAGDDDVDVDARALGCEDAGR